MLLNTAILTLLALAAVDLATAVGQPDVSLDFHWRLFKATYGKKYDDEGHELSRRLVWEKHVDFIARHNREHDMGLHSYTLGLNQFSDVPSEDFIRFSADLLFVGSDSFAGSTSAFFRPSNAAPPPPSVDWRTKGYVTPVVDQGQCGSSWAFGAIGSLEGQHFRSSGQLVELSVQNILDCSKDEGNYGCEGGYMDKAFLYVKKNDGVDTEKSYPYTGKDQKCKFNKSTVGATDTGYIDVKSGNETDLQLSVGAIGPVSCAVDASQPSFQMYKSGIYNDKACSTTPNHGALVVGYGSEGGKDFWIVKNSWGPSWGEQGYIRMSRNLDNQCGIATVASYPVV